MARHLPGWARRAVTYAGRGWRWLKRIVRKYKNRFKRYVWEMHLQKWVLYLTDSDYRFLKNSLQFYAYKSMPDEAFITRQFKAQLGMAPDLSDPKTFNEKIQWLKLYDRRPVYTVMADKYAVKQWVAKRIGAQYVVPALGVWDRFDEIDFDQLPDRFVLKCTHDSGSAIIVQDKNALAAKSALWIKENVRLDKNGVRRKLKACLKRNTYYRNREWAYKDIPPRILAEECMADANTAQLKEYKIFTFNGQPKLVQVYDKNSKNRRNVYTPAWTFVDVAMEDHPDPTRVVERPPQLEELLALSRKLACGIPFVRTDFYITDGQIRFGEMTFYPKSGYVKFFQTEWNRTLGDWIQLPPKSGREPFCCGGDAKGPAQTHTAKERKAWQR